jgi:hypothetical protein
MNKTHPQFSDQQDGYKDGLTFSKYDYVQQAYNANVAVTNTIFN